jgi:hypothetical protein
MTRRVIVCVYNNTILESVVMQIILGKKENNNGEKCIAIKVSCS